MKKLLLLSAFLIFACSSDDSSDTNDSNDDNNNDNAFICNDSSYESVIYGTQEWTVENACHTTYRDGTPIPEITDNAEWESLSTGAWCYIENDPTKPRLYNWYAVMGIHDTDPNTPNKEFAPDGWHVPTDTEWTTLEEYLNANGYNFDDTINLFGNTIAKSMASTSGWNSSNTIGAPGNDQSLNNSSGFNASVFGLRESFGLFYTQGDGGVISFWTSTEFNSLSSYSRGLRNDEIWLGRGYKPKKCAIPVRLVKD